MLKTMMVFVDLEKAYDRIPREELWICMRISGVATSPWTTMFADDAVICSDSREQVKGESKGVEDGGET